MFISNCRRLYCAGPVVTVDEMLAPFRGRVTFRMYIPLKPAKYGIKLFMVNDSRSQYALNAIPYLGKGSVQEAERPRNTNQGEFYTLELLKHIQEPGRVVVCDSWFTSLHLAQTLRSFDMHLVGTIRMNKPYIPSKSFVKSLRLPKDDTVLLYHRGREMALILKKVKAAKYVGVLSTLHNNLHVVEKTKTEAHMFYNAGKGGTDAFDQRCALTSCSRKSRRWSMAIFTQTVNIAMNNAFILYNESNVQKDKAFDKKAEYLHEIAYRMSRPWAVEKYQQTDRRHTENKTMIDMVFRLTREEKEGAPAQANAPDVAQDVAADVAPVVAADVAPVVAADVAPDVARVAVRGRVRHYNVPAAVPGSSRDVQPELDPPPTTPFLGGRWTRAARSRCSLCPQHSNWRGKHKCEMPECNHRDVCTHHSVILCQNCFLQN